VAALVRQLGQQAGDPGVPGMLYRGGIFLHKDTNAGRGHAAGVSPRRVVVTNSCQKVME
jgi:hypothetical protein